jgi:hypothetical protein
MAIRGEAGEGRRFGGFEVKPARVWPAFTFRRN